MGCFDDYPTLEEMIKESPDVEIEQEVSDFLTWLDTSDHWDST